MRLFSRPKLIVTLMAVLIAVAWLSFFEFKNQDGQTTSGKNSFSSSDFHVAYSMDQGFYGNLEKTEPDEISREKIYGGIVSHHFIMAREISKFFATIGKSSPKTIVLVGPDHQGHSRSRITASLKPYLTPWGELFPDKITIDRLLLEKSIAIEEDPFSGEHSISALVGFIKYYMPDVKIVPILTRRNTTREEAEKFGTTLAADLSENAIVISSVDFSHHLDESASRFHDEKSVSAVKNLDCESIYESEVDSPSSICIMLTFLRIKGIGGVKYTNTSSDNYFDKSGSSDITSYLFAYFYGKGNLENSRDNAVSILSLGEIGIDNKLRFDIENNIDIFEMLAGTEGNFLRGVDYISAKMEFSGTNEDLCIGGKTNASLCDRTEELLRKHNFNAVRYSKTDIQKNAQTDSNSIIESTRLNSNWTPSNGGEFWVYNSSEKRKIKIINIIVGKENQLSDLVKKFISQSKEDNLFVVAYIDWKYPIVNGNLDESHKNFAHAVIESGADLVLGNNGETLLPPEIFNHKAIFYSMGRLFGKAGEISLGVGAANNNDRTKYFIFPLIMDGKFPKRMSPRDANIFCNEYLKDVSGKKDCYFELTR